MAGADLRSNEVGRVDEKVCGDLKYTQKWILGWNGDLVVWVREMVRLQAIKQWRNEHA
ncbi:hypothetical protein KI387_010527, partial [Taxus chinensis]